MRPFRSGLWATLAALLLANGTARPDDKDGKVDLKVVKYDDLTKAIAQFKGKVLVIDFWQDT